MKASLGRRTAAEAIGTGLLVAVVVGSGIQATELTRDIGVQLPADSLATVFGLGVLVLLLGPVCGAHFNPAVTLVAWLTERHTPDGLTARDVAAYLPAQVAGAIGGAIRGRRDVRRAAGEVLHPRPVRRPPLAGRGRRHGRADPAGPRPGPNRPLRARSARGGLLHRGRLLVHLLHLLREPRGDRRQSVHRHLRRDRAASVAPFVAAQLLGAVLGLGLVAVVHGTRPALARAEVAVPPAEAELASP